MWTSRARPPPRSTSPTPFTVSIARFTCLSAISVSVLRLMASEETVTVITGSESGSTLVITGGSSSWGTRAIALATFSRTSLAASLMSRSRTNLTVMLALPSVMRPDVISSMPETLLSASSIGSTTELAISPGLAPGSRSATLTVAGSALGKRSTPRTRKEKIPRTTSDVDEHRREHGSSDAELCEHRWSPFGLFAGGDRWSRVGRRPVDRRRSRRPDRPCLTPLRIATRSPARSPSFSSRAASRPPWMTKTRLTPYRY